MRIITGRARGTKLYSLEGENITRPTSDRAKEAIFSIIHFSLEGRAVLDLFGGSGQMGLEALSRGAERAYICDNSPAAIDIIKKNVDKTRLGGSCTVLRGDYAELLSRLRGVKFDIVFLDPPYDKGLLPHALKLLFDYGLLKPTSQVVCESRSENIFAEVGEDKFKVIKSAKYGIASVNILAPILTESEINL